MIYFHIYSNSLMQAKGIGRLNLNLFH